MLGMNAVALVFFGCINVASVKQLLPQSGWTMALPVYYIALTTFVLLKIRGFFRINQNSTVNSPQKQQEVWPKTIPLVVFIIIVRRSGPGSGGYAPAWDCQ